MSLPNPYSHLPSPEGDNPSHSHFPVPPLPASPLDLEKAKTALGFDYRCENTYLTIRARVRRYLDDKDFWNREQMKEEEWEALVRFTLNMDGMEIVARRLQRGGEGKERVYREALELVLGDVLRGKEEGMKLSGDEGGILGDSKFTVKLPIKIVVIKNLEEYPQTQEELKSATVFETLTLLPATTIDALKDLVQKHYLVETPAKSISKLHGLTSLDGSRINKLELNDDLQVEAWSLVAEMKNPLVLYITVEDIKDSEEVSGDPTKVVEEGGTSQIIVLRGISASDETEGGDKRGGDVGVGQENGGGGRKRKMTEESWGRNKRRPKDIFGGGSHDENVELDYGDEESTRVEGEQSVLESNTRPEN
ncbi:hypothetical protein RUND412_009438 [Rhizina undulata]